MIIFEQCKTFRLKKKPPAKEANTQHSNKCLWWPESDRQLIEHGVVGPGIEPIIINERRTERLSSSAYVCASVGAFTTTERALVARMALVASTGFRLVQCSYLLCPGYSRPGSRYTVHNKDPDWRQVARRQLADAPAYTPRFYFTHPRSLPLYRRWRGHQLEGRTTMENAPANCLFILGRYVLALREPNSRTSRTVTAA